ncbi:MAG: glycosyltransferase family 2 protein [Alphaproteobacteria bacterium]|nr:glycosyltransferase family 2 protein [Alphaproteobacteria bacterium]
MSDTQAMEAETERLARLSPTDRFRAAFDLDTVPVLEERAVTAVVLAHNEAIRFPDFLDHHRRAGVGRFIVVDNASTDATADYLATQPDVVRLPSSRPYRLYKSIWRHLIADAYLDGRWALFVDVDELTIHPGWPDRSLPWFCERLDRQGADAAFATMVDMYPAQAAGPAPYRPGSSLIAHSPWFDTGNYRLVYRRARDMAIAPTPPFMVYGGARERLFHPGRSRAPTALDRLILRGLLRTDRHLSPGWLDRRCRRLALDVTRGALPQRPPTMSKVPLLRWRAGSRFTSGVHYLSPRYALSEDWAALLHFKYLDDFRERAEEAVRRGQHAGGAAEYKRYLASLEASSDLSPWSVRARRFTGTDDLVAEGLMRISRETAAAIGEMAD